MFSHHNLLMAVLLVTSIQSLGFAFMDGGPEITKVWLKRIVSSSRRPWIEGYKTIVQTSESSCADEVAMLIEAIESGQEWALQMLDASSSFQSGLMKGNFKDVGMYDECVEVNEQYNNHSIRGKHCTVSLGSLSSTSPAVHGVDLLRIFSSLCVPSSCNETHVEKIVNAIIMNTPAISDIEFKASETSCAQVGSDDLNAGEIYTIIFFSAVVVFMIACTICEIVIRLKYTEASTLLISLAKFSLYANAIAVLSTKVKPDTLKPIQGIRVLSMCWVILGHVFVTLFIRLIVNLFEFEEWSKSWASLYIEVAPFAVDNFFLVSGFLTTYLLLKAMKSGRRINWPLFYLRRYIRLTTALAVLTLFVSLLAQRLANGPLWNTLFTTGIETCHENWWVTLLYLQNLVDVERMCLPHTWYLAADMQLFWISPIVIYPLHRWPKHGVRILGFLLLASIVTPPVVLAINGYSNRVCTMRMDVGKAVLNDFYNFYVPTYNRAGAYFVGMFLGYDVVTKKRHFTKAKVLINWVTTIVLFLFCACATHLNYSNNSAYNRAWEVVFALTLRPCWSISMAWVIYACTHGHGGPVNKFLSLPFFVPLNRLSYSIYLVHFMMQSGKNAVARTPVLFSNTLIFYEYFADLPLSIVLAFVFTLFFESPIVVLEKIFFKSKSEANRVTLAQGTNKELHIKEAGIRKESTKED